MKRKTFILSTGQHEIIEVLSQEQKGDVFDALFHYAETGEKPQLDKISQAVFLCISKDIDRLWANYDKVCEVRREAGSKGGAPKGNSNARKRTDEELSDNSTSNKQTEELSDKTTKNNQNESYPIKQPDNDNDNDNENENEYHVNRKSERISEENPLGGAVGRIDGFIKKQNWKSCCTIIMQLWNEEMADLKSPQVNKLNTQRWQAVRTLVTNGYTGKDFEQAVRNAADSPYLQGDGEDGFVAKFDWVFLSAEHFKKVHDGDYRKWE